jgi:hypothetical protein
MKLASDYNELCFKQVFENVTAGRCSTSPLGFEQRELRVAPSAECSCSNWFKVA